MVSCASIEAWLELGFRPFFLFYHVIEGKLRRCSNLVFRVKTKQRSQNFSSSNFWHFVSTAEKWPLCRWRQGFSWTANFYFQGFSEKRREKGNQGSFWTFIFEPRYFLQNSSHLVNAGRNKPGRFLSMKTVWLKIWLFEVQRKIRAGLSLDLPGFELLRGNKYQAQVSKYSLQCHRACHTVISSFTSKKLNGFCRITTGQAFCKVCHHPVGAYIYSNFRLHRSHTNGYSNTTHLSHALQLCIQI